MFKIIEKNKQFILMKNEVARGVFTTMESAEENKKFYEEIEKNDNKTASESNRI